MVNIHRFSLLCTKTKRYQDKTSHIRLILISCAYQIFRSQDVHVHIDRGVVEAGRQRRRKDVHIPGAACERTRGVD